MRLPATRLDGRERRAFIAFIQLLNITRRPPSFNPNRGVRSELTPWPAGTYLTNSLTNFVIYTAVSTFRWPNGQYPGSLDADSSLTCARARSGSSEYRGRKFTASVNPLSPLGISPDYLSHPGSGDSVTLPLHALRFVLAACRSTPKQRAHGEEFRWRSISVKRVPSP